MYLSLSLSLYVYMYIYIYIYRERERTCVHVTEEPEPGVRIAADCIEKELGMANKGLQHCSRFSYTLCAELQTEGLKSQSSCSS